MRRKPWKTSLSFALYLPLFFCRFTLLLWADLQGIAGSVDGRHHIYKAGTLSTACTPGNFHPSYWATEKNGSALVGTAYAQSLIWRHQHPTSCKAVKYLIFFPAHHGIGSNVHLLGQTLAIAMALERVLLVAEDPSHPYYDAGFCTDTKSYHDCYFEAISSCNLSDAATSVGLASLDYSKINDISGVTDDRPNDLVVAVRRAPADRLSIPPVLQIFLDTSPVEPSKHFYWWRAQSASFVLRPNKKTLAEMQRHVLQIFPREKVQKGTISCHIRRGDKWTETAMTEDATYVHALEQLLVQAEHQGVHLNREVFLSTEDPQAIIYFENLKNWTTYYTVVPRKPDRNRSNQDYAREFGPARELINSLINLDLALQSDAWVGTLSSNWCRLIDELRSTLRCKASGLYLDAQQELSTANLDWRKH